MTIAPPAVSFFCRGVPQTKGSMIAMHVWRATGRCVTGMREDNPRLKEWRALVATAAKRAMGQRLPFTGPVAATLTFYFARPKSHTKAERECPYVAVNGRGDNDKLQRAIFDALTDAAVYDDDGRVAIVHSVKLYCVEDEVPGVRVRIEALS